MLLTNGRPNSVSLLGVVVVEVQTRRVHRHRREQHVVGIEDRARQRVRDDESRPPAPRTTSRGPGCRPSAPPGSRAESRRDPVAGLRRRGLLTAGQREGHRAEQRVARLARVDDLVEAEVAARSGTTPAARRRAARPACSSSERIARLDAPAPIAPRVAPGKENDAVWSPYAAIAITSEPNPYALRSVRWSFGVVACACAANIRAPLRRTPARSDLVPGSTPGLSARKSSGRWNESATEDEVRGLVGGGGVDRTRPSPSAGWRRSRPAWPPRCASAQMIGRSEPRLDLEPVAAVDDDVEDGAHVVDAAVVAGHDRQQLGQPRSRGRGVAGVDPTAGTTTRSTGSTTGTCGPGRTRRRSSGATLCTSPLRDRNRRAAELELVDLLADRLLHDRWPAP